MTPTRRLLLQGALFVLGCDVAGAALGTAIGWLIGKART